MVHVISRVFALWIRCASRDRIPGGPYQESWNPLDLEAQTGRGLPFRRFVRDEGWGETKNPRRFQLGGNPKIGVFTPNHPNFNKVFQYCKPSILGETPLFLETSGCFLSIIVVGCWFNCFLFSPLFEEDVHFYWYFKWKYYIKCVFGQCDSWFDFI